EIEEYRRNRAGSPGSDCFFPKSRSVARNPYGNRADLGECVAPFLAIWISRFARDFRKKADAELPITRSPDLVPRCIIFRMKGSLSRPISFVSVLVLLTSQTWATCGGGGGGGMGGMGGGSMGATTYPVPWKLIQAADLPLKDGLAVYWLPSSQKELEASS